MAMADERTTNRKGERWSLKDWSQLAQIAGTIGVVVSILTLAYQIRENTKTLRLSQMHVTLETYNQLRLAIMEHPEISKIARKGYKDRKSLKEDEVWQFEAYMAYLFYSAHAHFQRTVDVDVDSGLWKKSVSFYQHLLQKYPGVASWWCENKGGLDVRFIKTMEQNWPRPCLDPPSLKTSK
jgi:hypothetical protein